MQLWKSLSATVHVGNLTEEWNLAALPAGDANGIRVFRFAFGFSAPFEAPPVVHLSLTGFDIDQRDTSRLKVTATAITETGCTAEIETWGGTRVYAIAFSWPALGAWDAPTSLPVTKGLGRRRVLSPPASRRRSNARA